MTKLKTRFIAISFLLFLLMVSCDANSINDTSKQATDIFSTTKPTVTYKPDAKDEVEGYDKYKDYVLQKTFGNAKTGYELIYTKYAYENVILQPGSTSTVILYAVYESYYDEENNSYSYCSPYNSVLLIDTDNVLTCKLLYNNAELTEFHLVDLTGDSCMEIISFDRVWGACGGTGIIHNTNILKFNNNALENIEISEDPGFYTYYSDGFNIEIKNKYFTEFNLKFEYVDDDLREYFFNSDGKINEMAISYNKGLYLTCDPFYSLDIIDYDKDGIFEISTSQYYSHRSHNDSLGFGHCISKYDSETNSMKIITVDFG